MFVRPLLRAQRYLLRTGGKISWYGPEGKPEVKYVKYIERRSPLRRLGEEWPEDKPVHPDYYGFTEGFQVGAEGIVFGMAVVFAIPMVAAIAKSI